MEMHIERPTLYEVLQVTHDAEKSVIDAAYKARIMRHHPDKGGRKGLAAKLNQAADVLLDDRKRGIYDDELGKTIGNYRVVREIAEGGFGVTYEAEHIVLHERACIKQSLYVSEEHNDLLKREAKLLWDLHHHSLPTLRDFVECSDGSLALVMSYIEGPSLDKVVEDLGGKIPPEHVSWMSQRLLNALHYLHFNGVVHGDVKPQNVIIKPREHNAVLVDYGLSVRKPTHKTAPEGYTPLFAAPELVSGKPPLPESDLYSLGASMIYALGGDPITGKYPRTVPKPLREFYNSLVVYNPLDRPNWDKEDLVKKLSDIRLDVFGDRHSNSRFTDLLKGGGS